MMKGTIAERLEQIAENEQRVYDAGYSKGYEVCEKENKIEPIVLRQDFFLHHHCPKSYKYESGITFDNWVYNIGNSYDIYGYEISRAKTLRLTGARLSGTVTRESVKPNILFVTGFTNGGGGVSVVSSADIEVTPEIDDDYYAPEEYIITVPQGLGVNGIYFSCFSSGNPVLEIIEEADYSEGYSNGHIDGVKAGKQAEYDTLWNAIQDRGKRTNYYAAFAYSNYPLGVFKPKYKLQPENANRMFTATTIELADDEYLEIDLSKCADVYWMFRNCKIKRIGKCDLTSVTSATTGAFSLMSQTVEIKEIVSKASLTFASDMFNQSAALEKVIFSGEIGKGGLNMQWSKKLSSESIVSIINCLSATTSGLSITLSKTAVDAACVEIEESNSFDSTNSIWWAWLTGTKSNWTISLV